MSPESGVTAQQVLVAKLEIGQSSEYDTPVVGVFPRIFGLNIRDRPYIVLLPLRIFNGDLRMGGLSRDGDPRAPGPPAKKIRLRQEFPDFFRRFLIRDPLSANFRAPKLAHASISDLIEKT